MLLARRSRPAQLRLAPARDRLFRGEEIAEGAGIDYVEDECTAIVHRRLSGAG